MKSVLTPGGSSKLTAAKNLLRSPEAYTTTLITLCLDKFVYDAAEGDSMLGDAERPPWAMSTVAAELEAMFQVDVLEQNLHKIMAGVAILTSDDFFHDVKKFIWLCNVLAGDTFDPATFDPATCAEMAWGITETSLLREFPSDQPQAFSDEICRYIGYMLDQEGLAIPPDVLRIGIRDNNDQLSPWADDPELYSVAYSLQQDNSAAITDMLKSNLLELFQQIEQLPLTHGSAAGLLDKFSKHLSG